MAKHSYKISVSINSITHAVGLSSAIKIPAKGMLEMLLKSYFQDMSMIIITTTKSANFVQEIPRRYNLYKPPYLLISKKPFCSVWDVI